MLRAHCNYATHSHTPEQPESVCVWVCVSLCGVFAAGGARPWPTEPGGRKLPMQVLRFNAEVGRWLYNEYDDELK